MNPLRFEGVIFDLDGTLVQSEHLHRQSWVGPLAELGIEVEDDEYLRDFAGKPGMHIIRDQIGLDGDAAHSLYNRVTDAYWDLAADTVAPTDGLLEFLDRISPLAKAVCTSAQRASARRMLDLIGLTNRFDAIVTASDVNHGKPHPEPFHLAAKRLGLDGKQCLAIEDSANGLRSARAAGMRCVGIGDGRAVYGELADVWIKDFADPGLMRELLS